MRYLQLQHSQSQWATGNNEAGFWGFSKKDREEKTKRQQARLDAKLEIAKAGGQSGLDKLLGAVKDTASNIFGGGAPTPPAADAAAPGAAAPVATESKTMRNVMIGVAVVVVIIVVVVIVRKRNKKKKAA